MNAAGARNPLRDAEVSLFVLDEFRDQRRPTGRVPMRPGADDQARTMRGEVFDCCAPVPMAGARRRSKGRGIWLPLGRRADGSVDKRGLPLYVADEWESERDLEVREAENKARAQYTTDDEIPQVGGWAIAV